jgi:hypothetical protein
MLKKVENINVQGMDPFVSYGQKQFGSFASMVTNTFKEHAGDWCKAIYFIEVPVYGPKTQFLAIILENLAAMVLKLMKM